MNEAEQTAFDDLLNETADLMALVNAIRDAISCAECSETMEDLRANLVEAQDHARMLAKDIGEALGAKDKKVRA